MRNCKTLGLALEPDKSESVQLVLPTTVEGGEVGMQKGLRLGSDAGLRKHRMRFGHQSFDEQTRVKRVVHGASVRLQGLGPL